MTLRTFAAAALLTAMPAHAASLNAEVFLVYWPNVGGDANRTELDKFMPCLIDGSTFSQFFAGWGGVNLKYGGSVSLTAVPTGSHFGICDNDVSFTNAQINAGHLPQGTPGYMPL